MNWNQELRQAFRQLGRNRLVSGLAVLSLAIGIGATIVLFSVVDATILNPLPFPDSDRLVSLSHQLPTDGSTRGQLRLSDGDWLELQRSDHGFDEVAAIRSTGMPVVRGDRTLTPLMREATAGYFEMLGATPLRGRTLQTEDNLSGAGGVVVLAYGFWQEELGGSEEILGSVLELDRQPYTVVGIMPRGFEDPLYPTAPALWLPLRIDESMPLARGGRRGQSANLRVFGRLSTNESLSAVNARLEIFSASLADRFSENQDRTIVARPLIDETVQNHRATFLLLFAAVSLVLAVACINVGSLLLGQADQRRGDIAVRRSLGASTGALARQFLTESALLSLLGGALGLILAMASLPLAASWARQTFNLPSYNPIDLDLRVVAFSVVVSLASGLIFGLAPLRQAAKVQAGELRSVRTTASRRSSRVRRGLVISELALSTVLLIGAGLTIRSLLALAAVPAGVEVDSSVLLRTSARGAYAAPERWADFEVDVRTALSSLPGVEVAAASNIPPIFIAGRPIAIDLGEQALPGAEPTASQFVAGEGLFNALGTTILAGREFDSRDRIDSPSVVVVNSAFVDRFYASTAIPLGSTLRFADSTEPATVVGVVANIRRPGVRPEPVPMLFQPLAQGPRATISFVIRGSGDLGTLLASAERAIKKVSPESPVYSTSTVEDAVASLTSAENLLGKLLGGFAVVALFLACLGTYALLSQIVAERRREFGIRVAFGANASNIVGMVRRDAMSLGVMGVGLGAALAMLGTSGLRAQLYGVQSSDPMTYLAVGVVLVLVVVVAAVVPARRAGRTDPVVALRSNM